jgi:hypothetical protein
MGANFTSLHGRFSDGPTAQANYVSAATMAASLDVLNSRNRWLLPLDMPSMLAWHNMPMFVGMFCLRGWRWRVRRS